MGRASEKNCKNASWDSRPRGRSVTTAKRPALTSGSDDDIFGSRDKAGGIDKKTSSQENLHLDCDVDARKKEPSANLNLSLVQRCGASNAFHPVGRDLRTYSPVGWYLSEFREEDKLGEGGFGVVYRSTHLLSNQSFAVKKIRLSGTKKGEVDTLLREVRTLAKIGSHCNGEGTAPHNKGLFRRTFSACIRPMRR
jgi:hypothetical protein